MIETDCEVDFAPPLDYVEPNRAERLQDSVSEPAANGEHRLHLNGCILDDFQARGLLFYAQGRAFIVCILKQKINVVMA